MNFPISYFISASGARIPYFTENKIIWISAVDVARLLNYIKPHGAIKRHGYQAKLGSVSNKKKFSEFDFKSRVPGIQSTRIFINFYGFQELLIRHGSYPLAVDWLTTAGFLSSTENSKSVEAYQALIDILATPAIESSRKKVALQINQGSQPTQLKENYTKLATLVIELTKELDGKYKLDGKYSKQSLSILEQIVLSLREL